MTKNTRTIILIIIASLATLGLTRFIMTLKKDAQEKVVIQKDKLVQVSVVKPGSNVAQVELNGQVKAVDKIELFSEVSGILLNRNFKEGQSFKRGEVLINIDNQEFNPSLKAKKSMFIAQVATLMGDLKIDFPDELTKWDAFLLAINLESVLPELPALNDVKFKRYLAGKNLLNTYYQILAMEEKLLKYKVIAPFDGVVTRSIVNKGVLVRPGQKIGEFIDPNQLEYVTEVSLSDLNFLKIKNQVELFSEDLNRSWKGSVRRINEKIEAGSQRVKVYVMVNGKGIKEGMFLTAKIKNERFEESVVLEWTQINDNCVYVVKNGLATKKQVNLVHEDRNHAIVTGLSLGDSLITSSLKGVYQNLKVIVK